MTHIKMAEENGKKKENEKFIIGIYLLVVLFYFISNLDFKINKNY